MADASLIAACNQALGQIAKGEIQDLDEGSLESAECARFAPALLDEVADWTTWPKTRVRTTLAAVTNDRPAEWLYAFARPSDCAKPAYIRDGSQLAANCLPIYGPTAMPYQDTARIAFIIEGDVVYTNVEIAVLQYTRSVVTMADLEPKGRRAFVLELATRISLPLGKDAKLADALSEKATLAKLDAIADAENKCPREEPEYISDGEWARMGVGV